jgi:hypothetical protein
MAETPVPPQDDEDDLVFTVPIVHLDDPPPVSSSGTATRIIDHDDDDDNNNDNDHNNDDNSNNRNDFVTQLQRQRHQVLRGDKPIPVSSPPNLFSKVLKQRQQQVLRGGTVSVSASTVVVVGRPSSLPPPPTMTTMTTTTTVEQTAPSHVMLEDMNHSFDTAEFEADLQAHHETLDELLAPSQEDNDNDDNNNNEPETSMGVEDEMLDLDALLLLDTSATPTNDEPVEENLDAYFHDNNNNDNHNNNNNIGNSEEMATGGWPSSAAEDQRSEESPPKSPSNEDKDGGKDGETSLALPTTHEDGINLPSTAFPLGDPTTPEDDDNIFITVNPETGETLQQTNITEHGLEQLMDEEDAMPIVNQSQEGGFLDDVDPPPTTLQLPLDNGEMMEQQQQQPITDPFGDVDSPPCLSGVVSEDDFGEFGTAPSAPTSEVTNSDPPQVHDPAGFEGVGTVPTMPSRIHSTPLVVESLGVDTFNVFDDTAASVPDPTLLLESDQEKDTDGIGVVSLERHSTTVATQEQQLETNDDNHDDDNFDNDDDDFGDFDEAPVVLPTMSDPEHEDDFGYLADVGTAPGVVDQPTDTDTDPFGDFAASPPSGVDQAQSFDDDDFGDFGAAPTIAVVDDSSAPDRIDNGGAVPDRLAVDTSNPPEMEPSHDDEFGDFDAAPSPPSPNAMDVLELDQDKRSVGEFPPVPDVHSISGSQQHQELPSGDDDFGDFGDFDQAPPAALPPASSETLTQPTRQATFEEFGDFEGEAQVEQNDEFDDFGDFGDAVSSPVPATGTIDRSDEDDDDDDDDDFGDFGGFGDQEVVTESKPPDLTPKVPIVPDDQFNLKALKVVVSQFQNRYPFATIDASCERPVTNAVSLASLLVGTMHSLWDPLLLRRSST